MQSVLSAAAHASLGLGPMPQGPLVGYLIRSASALYALHGALALFLSFDVRRYWRVITFLAAPMRIGTTLVGIMLLDHGGEIHSYTDDELALTGAVAKLAALVIERERLLSERGQAQARELALREAESKLGSVTGGNGAIYAVRRRDYVEVDPRFGHDLALPYLMVQRGRRAVYEPAAVAFEKPTPTNETEYRRKVRMFEHAWLIVLRGRMLSGQPLGYRIALVSHRHLRYASGLLHLVLLASSIA